MVPTKNVHSAYDERALTCCTMCQKVHPTPSTCVSDRTTNNYGCMPNDCLTLKFTQTFAIHLRNVHQMARSVKLFPLHSLPYKYPLH
jgi:hypothetical protein